MRQDLISRCELFNRLATVQTLGEAYAVIQDMPTEPERKKGKWIEVDDYFNRISGRCSACGWEAHMYEDDVVGMNYCPNCGADMRGEQDG